MVRRLFPQKTFTERSKAVLLLRIICVIYVLCSSCFRICSLLPSGHLLGNGLFVMSNCDFVTFPCGILGEVWYLIVLIPDLCRLSYFARNTLSTTVSKFVEGKQLFYTVIAIDQHDETGRFTMHSTCSKHPFIRHVLKS